jgi:hypothetical protein
MADTIDPAAPALNEIRADLRTAADSGLLAVKAGDYLPAALARHSRTLLAAVEAALKLHQPGCVTILGALCKRHRSHRFFSITSTEADDVRSCPDCAATVYNSCTGCGPQVSVDSCPTRNGITAALAGKEADDDGST